MVKMKWHQSRIFAKNLLKLQSIYKLLLDYLDLLLTVPSLENSLLPTKQVRIELFERKSKSSYDLCFSGQQSCRNPISHVDRCMDATQIAFKFAKCPTEQTDSRGMPTIICIAWTSFLQYNFCSLWLFLRYNFVSNYHGVTRKWR